MKAKGDWRYSSTHSSLWRQVHVRGHYNASAALLPVEKCSRHPLNSGLSGSRVRCGCFRDVASLLLILSEIRRSLGRADYIAWSFYRQCKVKPTSKISWSGFECHTEFQDLRDTGVSEVRMLQCYYRYAPHNDVSVKDGPHIRQWSHKIMIL